MIDKEIENYMDDYIKKQELIKVRLEILDEIYVAGNPHQTYLNVVKKINLLLNLQDSKLN